MKSFRNSSIQWKLAAVILAISCSALAVACAGFAVYQRASLRVNMIAELSALADTLGANSAASLMFSDRKSAHDLLRALGSEKHILAACLYDSQGRFLQNTAGRNSLPRFKCRHGMETARRESGC